MLSQIVIQGAVDCVLSNNDQVTCMEFKLLLYCCQCSFAPKQFHCQSSQKEISRYATLLLTMSNIFKIIN